MEYRSEEEIMAAQEMKLYYDKYEQTGDPDNLYKAKEIADNWNWGSGGSNEGKEGAQKVLKLVRDYEEEQGMSM